MTICLPSILETAELFTTVPVTLLFDLIYFADGFGDLQVSVSVFLSFY
jgi:hypothetical protein